MKQVGFILITFFLCFHTKASVGDTTKVKYDINDPRNPDCPCHKYQKIADEEYNKMIANEDLLVAVQNAADNIIDAKEHAQKEVKTATNKIVLQKEENIKEEKIDARNPEITSSNKTETTKVNKHVFKKHRSLKHQSTKPKKRKVRFGRKDGSRCTHW